VMWPVTLPGSWVASTKRCKDAGSAYSSAIGATEDAAARRCSRARGPANVAGYITSSRSAVAIPDAARAAPP
jgi:hypothetical protein